MYITYHMPYVIYHITYIITYIIYHIPHTSRLSLSLSRDAVLARQPEPGRGRGTVALLLGHGGAHVDDLAPQAMIMIIAIITTTLLIILLIITIVL